MIAFHKLTNLMLNPLFGLKKMSEVGTTETGQVGLGAINCCWFVWACYFLALLVIAVFQTITSLDVWGHSLLEAARETHYGDPNSFASAAMDVSSQGWVTQNTSWIFNLWPPGFVLLEALLLTLFGSNAPMPLLLLVISAGLFAAIMMEMRRILVSSFGQWAWLIPLLIFCFAEARVFLISPLGLMFGEWLSIACFFWAVLLLVRTTLKAAILAGMFFAFAAYARSQFEFFLNVMLFVSIALAIVSSLRKKQGVDNWSQASRLLLIALLVAQLFMLPWRIYHLNQGHDLRWVYTGPLIIEASLSTDIALQEKGGGFLAQGGINMACHIAPEHCGETSSSVYWRIFLGHPYEWIKGKVKLLPRYWFAPTTSLTVPNAQPDLVDVLLKGALLVCFVGMLWSLWRVRDTNGAPAWLGVSLGLVAAHCVIIAFSHFEVRYFFFIKMYSLFSFTLLLSVPTESRPYWGFGSSKLNEHLS
ncbi:hypothetical protein ACH50O_04445 [Methylomonas sp. 2BW1-5-20]|uniref:hypothetical protein n=1 Tax=Methylomonas sp. 2BW1-5-20 TaxID=3376686 RepID=UPI00404DB970